MTERKIGLREVRALKPGQTVWDAAVAGFGARRQQSPAVSYVLIYRTQEGRQRWHTIGRHGAPWTPETAREEAKRLLGKVVDEIDPSAVKKAKRKAATVAELCDLYLADAEAGRLLTRRKLPKKASTLTIDRGRIARHIKPLLGQMKVAAVTREDVDAFMHDIALGKTAGNTKTARKRGLARVRGGKGAASRAVGLLGGIFTYAVAHRMRADNPVRGVIRFADGKRERRLSDGEYKMLGDALRLADAKRNLAGGSGSCTIPSTHRLALWGSVRTALGERRPRAQNCDAAEYKNRAVGAPAVTGSLRHAAHPHAARATWYSQLHEATLT